MDGSGDGDGDGIQRTYALLILCGDGNILMELSDGDLKTDGNMVMEKHR